VEIKAAKIVLFTVLFAPLVAGQTSAPVTSQSASIAAQEAAALCPQGIIADVLLTGTASRFVTLDNETGQVVLQARAKGQRRIDLALGSGTRTEIRINDSLNPQFATLVAGQWVTGAIHNSWVDANWFFPALSALVVGPVNSFNLGFASDSSHLFSQFQIANQRPGITSEIQNLSTVLYDVDASTHLPAALHFFTHPDDDLNVKTPVDVEFSDYRVVNGVQVPFRIQRYVNGTLQLDIASVTINPGLLDSDFSTN
jgi:hypothetical protein